MRKLVIFDLDGTLVDTIQDLAAAANHVMKYLGYPTHTLDEYRLKVGNGISKLLLRSLPEDLEDKECLLEKMRSLFIAYYDLHNTDLSKPYEGIPELLSRLQAMGLELSVASNKYQSATMKVIRTYFPQVRFHDILGQREGIPIKPHPHIVEDILQSTGLGKEDVLYVGDSLVDVQTAHNAGVDMAAVSWGFRPRQVLQDAGAKVIIDHPLELLDCL